MICRCITWVVWVAVLLPVLPAGAQEEGYFEGDAVDSQDYEWVEDDASQGTQQPEAEIDTEYFYDQLAPFGDWIWTPEYGWVWHPSGLDASWRPYTMGYWTYADVGWTWVSNFDWGWAAFHYGSWAYLDHIGWVWVPGSVWSPARVIWRYSGAHVGWAPIIAGYDYWYGWAYYPVYYHHWTFIDWHHFCHRHPHRHYVHRNKVRAMFRHTYYPRRCRDSASGACHRGPSRRTVGRIVKRDIPVYRLSNVAKTNRISRPKASLLGHSGDKLKVFRPRNDKILRRPAVNRNVKEMRVRDLGRVQDRPRPVQKPTVRPQTDTGFRPRPGATIKARRPNPFNSKSGLRPHKTPLPTRQPTKSLRPRVTPNSTRTIRPSRTIPSKTLVPSRKVTPSRPVVKPQSKSSSSKIRVPSQSSRPSVRTPTRSSSSRSSSVRPSRSGRSSRRR